jgi:hypothetical protein
MEVMRRILEQLDRIRERNRSQPGWEAPTDEQKDEGKRAFEDAIERIRAERQAIRDFSVFVAGLAARQSLGEISREWTERSERAPAMIRAREAEW